VIKTNISSIAIGGFDGMHLAHQRLFSSLDKDGAIVVIETGYANLTPKNYRQEYTQYPISYYPLEDIKHLSGEQFIALLLEEFPNLKKIVVGFDFCFGANRRHCIDDLKALFSGEVIVIDEVKLQNIAIHSRVIRRYIADGQIDEANKLLGKNYKIVGTQIAGQGLGKKEFVPTINLRVEGFLLPNEGVYITQTKVDGTIYPSVSFIGHRVSTDSTFAIETHILDKNNFKINLNTIEIMFLKKTRQNKQFNDFNSLKKQIDQDIKEAKSFFKNY
jgi:riboflavin kinase/FMN adenylyltransferase